MSSEVVTPDSSSITPLHSFDRDDTVALQVGSSEHVLLAHASYLTRNSEFFKAALKKEWAEGQTQVIKMPEERPHVVAHYLNYIYSKTLPSCVSPADDTMTSKEIGSKHNQLTAELYVLGERLLDDSIRWSILRKIIDMASHFTPINEAANIIYRGTPVASPARRLMVDIMVTRGEDDWLDDSCEAAFLLDVAKAFCSKARANVDTTTPARALDPFHYAF